VDGKRKDALAMLHAMLQARARQREEGIGAPAPAFRFENSSHWNSALAAFEKREERHVERISGSALLDELRLRGDVAACHRAERGALLRSLAARESERQGLRICPALLRRTAGELWRERGLGDAKAIDDWRSEQALDDDRLQALLENEACLRWSRALREKDSRRLLDLELRTLDVYGELSQAVREKRELMAAQSIGMPDIGEAPMPPDEEALWSWYFRDYLRQPWLEPEERTEFARRLGFVGILPLRRLVLEEYWCSQLDRRREPSPDPP
jgi:hypothetical protein